MKKAGFLTAVAVREPTFVFGCEAKLAQTEPGQSVFTRHARLTFAAAVARIEKS